MRQLIRYAIIGILNNAIAYVLYLVLTYHGMGHKLAMSLLYCLGVAQTFYFNRRWTFEHSGHMSSALIRYISVYGLGYIFNLAMLVLLVDRLGLPHQWVQATAVFVIAAFLFLAQKIWVFSPATRRNEI
nr:GtrA family protein [uncultured Albidiferax sp.]